MKAMVYGGPGDDFVDAYDVFSDVASTHALKVLLAKH